MENTKFSIISLIYNTKIEYIDLALKSIFNLNYDNFEVILIDDGSNQEVKEYIAQYEDKAIIKHQENMGMPASSLEGLKLATGDYIVYVDFDDYINPEALNIFNKIINEHHPDVILHDFVRFTDDINNIKRHNPYFKQGPVSKQEALRQLCLLHTNTAWCRTGKRELYEGMADNIDISFVNGEDVQQSAYVLLNANSFYYTSETIYYYRVVEEHRDYYDVSKLNDCNFLIPVYNQVFRNDDNNVLLSAFKTSAANSIVYNAFRICLWEKDNKKRNDLLNQLNQLEITKLTSSINENIPFVSSILFYLFTHKHYLLLNLLAKLYDLIYGMQKI